MKINVKLAKKLFRYSQACCNEIENQQTTIYDTSLFHRGYEPQFPQTNDTQMRQSASSTTLSSAHFSAGTA